MGVYEEILKGSKAHPIKRENICLVLNKSDRQVRKQIEELRAKGERICYSPTKSGYYIAASDEEYFEFRQRYISYALRQLYLVNKMDRKSTFNYESIEEQICMTFGNEEQNE